MDRREVLAKMRSAKTLRDVRIARQMAERWLKDHIDHEVVAHLEQLAMIEEALLMRERHDRQRDVL